MRGDTELEMAQKSSSNRTRQQVKAQEQNLRDAPPFRWMLCTNSAPVKHVPGPFKTSNLQVYLRLARKTDKEIVRGKWKRNPTSDDESENSIIAPQ